MSLREAIKNNMRTEQEVAEEKAKKQAARIQLLKQNAIDDFKREIINKSHEGVKGNVIKGAYNLGHLPRKKIPGKKGLFSKNTSWDFFVDAHSEIMIKLTAIQEYALQEQINISIEILPVSKFFHCKINFDKFPKISVKETIYEVFCHDLFTSDLKLVIHYSVSL